VRVAQPIEKSVASRVEVAGRFSASKTVEIRAPVDGLLLEIEAYAGAAAQDFVEGGPVKHGALLYVVARESHLAGPWISAVAARQQAEAQRERVETAGTDAAQAQAAVDAAQSALEQLRARLGGVEVRAPFAGQIGRRRVSVGSFVTAGTLLTTLCVVDPVHVQFAVDEKTLLRLLKQQRQAGGLRQVEVAVGRADEDDFPREGRLDLIETQSDEAGEAPLLRAVVSNPDGDLFAGLPARIRLTLGAPEPALLVEPSAVAADLGGSYVLVYSDRKIVEQRYVDLGELVDGLRVVAARRHANQPRGIGPREYYVVEGMARVRPGMTVDVPSDGEDRDIEAETPARPGSS
jgi:RND family efflux transporter MFP subunit